MDLGELVGSLRLEDSQFGQALSGALDKLQDFGASGLKIAGAAGAAIAVGLTASLVQNLSMDAANDKLAAQLGLSAAESEKAGKIAGDLYADAYGESLDQVNDAVGAVMSSIDGMADASAAEVEAATAKVLDFATAFEVDVTRAAQVAGQMISTGLAGDADEAFDLLVASSQRVPAALREDLLDAVDEYGQFFATLGYSGEEAFAVLVEGSEKGMYGIDKAGDAVKEFTIRATDMSTASQEAYGAIGLDAEEMANKILAGGEDAAGATQQIIDGLLNMKDPAAQAQAAIALFGTPLEDLNASEIPTFLQSLSSGSDAMDGFGGAADRMGTTLNSNAQTSLTSLKRQAELFFVGLTNWAVPAVDNITGKMATGFGPALSAVGDLLGWVAGQADLLFGPLGGNSAVISTLAAIIGGVLLIALTRWAIQAGITATANVTMWTVTQLGAIRAAATTGIAIAGMIAGWVLMGAQALAQAARMAAAWLIALGPIGWAIAAIAAVVILIIKYWDDIKKYTKAAWDWVVAQVKKVPGLIVGFFRNFTLPGLIIKHWDSIKRTFSSGASAVVGFMRDLPGRIVRSLGNLGSLLLGVGEDIMNGLIRGIENGFNWVRDKLSGVGRLIPGWLKNVLGIASPSKVMRDQVGQWIPAGVAEGIEAGADKFLTPALDRMAASVTVPITASADYQASVANLSRAGNRVDMAASAEGPFSGLTGGGPLVEQKVYPQPSMSEKQVGDHAANRLVFALQNG